MVSNMKISLNGNIVIYNDDIAYKSTIEDIDEKEAILINVPIGKGKQLFIEELGELEVNYYGDSCYYIFNTRFISRENDNEMQMPLYKIEWPYNVKKIQRRDFVRVDFVDYMYTRPILEDVETKWHKDLMLNLSGGGLRFKTSSEYNVHDVVEFKLFLDGNSYFIKARIVRDMENFDNGKIYAAEFIDIKESVREKVIQHVFKQMRKQHNSL